MLTKFLRRLALSLAVLFVVAPCIAVNSSGESLLPVEQEVTAYTIDYYEYSIPENWDTMTVRERVEALIIPEEIISQMSDEALIQAIVDYPYLVDIYLYGGDVVVGLEIAREYFSALDEFLVRSSAAESLNSYNSNTAALCVASVEESTEESLSATFLSKAMRDIQAVLSLRMDKTRILDAIDMALDGEWVASGYVYTPRGTAVSMDQYIDTSTEAERNALDAQIVARYGVELVSGATHTYNCHSYAWNMRHGGAACWIFDPSPYMDDGSYIRSYRGVASIPAYQSGVVVGDIILYDNNSHSAILIGSPNTGAPLEALRCESKWTAAGVYRHSLSNVPYGYKYTTITVWREN